MSKTCIKCGAAERYKDGRCAPCARIFGAAWCAANPEKMKAKRTAAKGNAAYQEKSAATRKVYLAANKEKVAVTRKAWCAANKEKMAAYDKRYRDGNGMEIRKSYREANKENLAARRKVYDDANKDKITVTTELWRAENKEMIAAKAKVWQLENPDKCSSHAAERRARKLCATPVWANRDAIHDFYVTADGLNMLLGDWHHVDHIVPLKSHLVCGLHVEHNLQVLLGSENVSKGNRHWPDMPSTIKGTT